MLLEKSKRIRRSCHFSYLKHVKIDEGQQIQDEQRYMKNYKKCLGTNLDFRDPYRKQLDRL